MRGCRFLYIIVLITVSLFGLTVPEISALLQRGTCLIVVVNFDEGQLKGYGTGFFARNKAGEIRIYTANHVVMGMAKGDEITVGILRDPEGGVPDILYKAEHAACDPDVDMAALRPTRRRGSRNELRTWYPMEDDEIEKAFSDRLLTLEMGRKLLPGDVLHMAGYPWLGLMNTYWQYSNGTVAGRAEGMLLIGSMQPFDHGQSGGPLVDAEGHVVAIADAITEQTRQANLALPATELRFMWEDESEYEGKCSLPGDIETMNFTGRVTDRGKQPLTGIQVIFFPRGTVMEQSSPDDIITGGQTDNFGEFSTEHKLPCPATYVVALVDPSGRYLTSAGEVFFDCGDYWNFEMEVLPQGQPPATMPTSIADGEIQTPAFYYRGDIAYDTGDRVSTGLITVFQSTGTKDEYLRLMKAGNTEDASGLAIGAGFAQAGRYEIVMYSDLREVALLVTDIVQGRSISLPAFTLEDDQRIVIPK